MAISMAMSDTDKFMDKFDPINSNREKRKKMRTQPGSGNESTSTNNGGRKNGNNKRDNRKAGYQYNEKGLLIFDGADLCDCLSDNCPGCFFPCPKCRSAKCGTECRVNRRWVLETVTVDGTTEVIKNKHLPPQ
ncbi:ARL14 effector protein-like isoform X1 [Daphnia pulex]|uniref:ARL14 effector protein-like isoform X1 n=1 Tax=Daphnia pulex TaxID=6669 RepID=UPI001EE0A07C|nr:ARL14 effector protein-like isoform X1 [Daphnia pulex]XP_046439159.1 ARL14 effector protein-like isoform X1 [Daphnia pulex]XP_046639656.1 ARL14 effector protein-like isoform X1 [Daphnia pulicaria]